MEKLRKNLNRVIEVLCFLSFLAMVLLVCWQVITRYLLKSPSSWSEELVSFLFAWMTLLGSSVVVGERKHMNIPILYERLEKTKQKVLLTFFELVIILVSGFIMVYGGTIITKLSFSQLTSSINVPLGVFYIIVPICGCLNIFYSLLNIHDIWKEGEK